MDLRRERARFIDGLSPSRCPLRAVADLRNRDEFAAVARDETWNLQSLARAGGELACRIGEEPMNQIEWPVRVERRRQCALLCPAGKPERPRRPAEIVHPESAQLIRRRFGEM